jgi:hypothetical protein
MNVRRRLWLSSGVVTGLVLAFFAGSLVLHQQRQQVRDRAWEKIAPRLDTVAQTEEAEIDRSLNALNTFFEMRKARTPEFAKAVLSLRGKWTFIRGKISTLGGILSQTGVDDEQLRFLQEQFEACVFKPDDLKAATEFCVRSYLTSTQRSETGLLAAIRTDLGNMPSGETAIPALRTETVFQREYQEMLKRVIPEVPSSIGGDLALKVAAFVAGEITKDIAVRVLVAVATRLGVTAGLVSGGAASSWATLGIGLIAAIVVDIAFDRIAGLAGYDPVDQVAAKVNGTLDQVRSLLVDGDPEKVKEYANLRKVQESDPRPDVRMASKQKADSIEKSGDLGLRHALRKLQQARSTMRRGALRRLVLNGESL